MHIQNKMAPLIVFTTLIELPNTCCCLVAISVARCLACFLAIVMLGSNNRADSHVSFLPYIGSRVLPFGRSKLVMNLYYIIIWSKDYSTPDNNMHYYDI